MSRFKCHYKPIHVKQKHSDTRPLTAHKRRHLMPHSIQVPITDFFGSVRNVDQFEYVVDLGADDDDDNSGAEGVVRDAKDGNGDG